MSLGSEADVSENSWKKGAFETWLRHFPLQRGCQSISKHLALSKSSILDKIFGIHWQLVLYNIKDKNN